ncbi:invasion associated locus B family protein [Agrobacterium albertimagni AOL15]|uniref:Invasion associated locus B family protein n=1 Tax=Agrobacterium albertimagni AOL15 TaxID=1156935 RepID=K2Q8N4_9HYPH|nr:invasion associated locus B family protein [Agrobacterium albertimagni]EKF61570.1 invasion associated locus B family protein [Agrobacterium albertimagni AOL15]
MAFSRHAAIAFLAISTHLTFMLGIAVAAPLPGGASSLVETHEDWSVACQASGEVTSCVVRQVQSNNQTQQVVLTAEIAKTPDGKFAGALMLPLGLSLAPGVQLKIGDVPLGATRPFSLCVQQGCLVPLDVTEDVIAKLRAGSALNITVTAGASAQPVHFAVSLKGFSKALNRITELTQ